jgi:hypothetical protein
VRFGHLQQTELAGQRGSWSLDFRQVTQARSAAPTSPLKPRDSSAPPPSSAIQRPSLPAQHQHG